MSLVCVTIARGTHKKTIKEYHEAAQNGCRLVELRLDFIRNKVSLTRLLENKPAPVVITCRRTADGGLWRGSEEERLTLLRTAIASGVDYVDLEDDIAAKIPRYGKTKRIVSFHNFIETPKNLDDIHARMAQLDPDIIKIATTATTPHHNLRALRLVRDSKIPTIAFCMGELGAMSRIMLAKFGGPFTYASFDSERVVAPGQFTYKEMMNQYRYESINADTEFYGVVADPVGHSLSPHVHNAAFVHLGLNKIYLPMRVSSVDLEIFLKDCQELGIRGLSVTIPHKESVIPHLAQNDESVKQIGACNTMIRKDGKWIGYNTDSIAAMAAIDRMFPSETPAKAMQGKTALVLGAGGAAKALVYGLTQRGADVAISARTEARAQVLANEFKARVVPWGIRSLTKAHMIVNCTPVGMHPNVNDTPFDGAHFKAEQVVFDTVYRPEQTLFIKQAREKGARTITGADMFVGQAALQAKVFIGGPAPVDVMMRAYRKAISAVRDDDGSTESHAE